MGAVRIPPPRSGAHRVARLLRPFAGRRAHRRPADQRERLQRRVGARGEPRVEAAAIDDRVVVRADPHRPAFDLRHAGVRKRGQCRARAAAKRFPRERALHAVHRRIDTGGVDGVDGQAQRACTGRPAHRLLGGTFTVRRDPRRGAVQHPLHHRDRGRSARVRLRHLPGERPAPIRGRVAPARAHPARDRLHHRDRGAPVPRRRHLRGARRGRRGAHARAPDRRVDVRGERRHAGRPRHRHRLLAVHRHALP